MMFLKIERLFSTYEKEWFLFLTLYDESSMLKREKIEENKDEYRMIYKEIEFVYNVLKDEVLVTLNSINNFVKDKENAQETNREMQPTE